MEAMDLPTLDDFRQAALRIRANVYRTPAVRLPVDEALFAKAENLQRTGSFKLRGASNFVARMDPAVRARGVVTHSSGNHAQGVACAAALAGIPATVVIPEDGSELKVRRTKGWGAEVVRSKNDKASREGTAERLAQEKGATLLPPYDHAWVLEGQGTLALELLEDLPDVANVLVPVGGGGLLSGVAAALRAAGSGTQVIGVEPELAADGAESFAAGRIVSWGSELTVRTVADGVRTQALGEINFPIIQATVDAFVTVTEEAILDAAAWYLREAHLTVEPTGALALAAYRLLASGEAGTRLRPGPTAVVISGGNVDPGRIVQLAERPLA